MSAPTRAQRVALMRLQASLSQRELAVIADVERYRYLSSRQIEELHFSGHASELTGSRTCRSVLRRLARLEALRRLERRIGGVRAGSASFVYALGPVGQRLLHEDERWRYRYHEPSLDQLEHTLEVAGLVVGVKRAAREGTLELLDVEAEPACWRHFARGLAGREVLKPDLALALGRGEYEYRWFVEVDLATHSPAAVVRKCHAYHAYWATGAEQERSGVFPKVLILAPHERRAQTLRRAIASASHLNAELFVVDLLAQGAAHISEAIS